MFGPASSNKAEAEQTIRKTDNIREFLEITARSLGLDHLRPETWYDFTQAAIMKAKVNLFICARACVRA